MIICIFIPNKYLSDERERERSNDQNKEKVNKNILKLIPIFVKNKIIVTSVMGLSFLCYVITVIQFWGSDYLESVLGLNKDQVSISFLIVCLTAPSIGVLIGGGIIYCIGGYDNIKSSYLCLFGALGAVVLSIPIPFVKDFMIYISLLYGILLFGGAIFPSILGVIISSTEPKYKSAVSSFTVSLCNLFGYIPAPFVYGLINDNVSKTWNNLPFLISVYVSFIGFVFILASSIFRYYKLLELSNKRKSFLSTMSSDDKIKNIIDKSSPFNSPHKEGLPNAKSSISIGLLYNNPNVNLMGVVFDNADDAQNRDNDVCISINQKSGDNSD